MVFHSFDDQQRPRLEWPEPLVLDTIMAIYASDDGTAARLHDRFLRALIDDAEQVSGPLRLELIGCCAARGIAPELIAAADLAVFRELTAIIEARFRHSPRLRIRFLHSVHRSIGTLAWRNAAAGLGPAPRPAERPSTADDRRHPSIGAAVAGVERAVDVLEHH